MIGKSRLAALGHRDFRLLWGGQVVSTIGTHMQLFAINWHVYQLLRNQFFTVTLLAWHLRLNAQVLGLGTLGAIRVLPICFFALLGGWLADRYNRRQLILYAQILSSICAVILTVITFSGQATVLLLYILTAIGVAVTAFDEPAQNALFPELVPREHLSNAVTLYALLWQLGTIAGPAFAGIVIGSTSLGFVYALNTLSFAVALLTIFLVRSPERAGRIITQEKHDLRRGSVREGIRFVWSTRLIRDAMLLDCFATFFASARTMLPFVADQMLHAGVQGYGLLAIAQPVGSIVTGIVLALKKSLHRQGLIFLLSVALYGLATALFGLSTLFAFSALLYGLTGVGDTISTVIRSNIYQQLTPSEMRGRMNSIHMIVAFGGPQFGELEAGIVAALIGVPLTIFSGGLITLLIVGWYVLRSPDLRAMELEHPAA